MRRLARLAVTTVILVSALALGSFIGLLVPVSPARATNVQIDPAYNSVSMASEANSLRGYASTTANTATTLIAAQGAAVKIKVAAVQCWNSSAAGVVVTLNDSAATAFYVPATSGPVGSLFPIPLSVALNTALTFTAASATTTVGCSAQGLKGS